MTDKKKIIIKIIIFAILSILISGLLEKFYFTAQYNIERDILVALFVFYIFSHFIFDINKMYDFIYRKRYIIAGVTLVIFTILGYHGSSISYWDNYIQSSYSKEEYQPILGQARAIRSDEWVVNTPLDLSQSKLENKFSNTNNISRASDTKVALITKSPVLGLNILVNQFKVFYIFFGNNAGLSFWWYGRLFALLLVSFEMLMMITKKNKKISFFGSLIITFAPVVQWWFSTPIVDILIYGGAAMLLLDKLLREEKLKFKILYSVLLGIVGASYICCYYPAWQVSFGYFFLMLGIWIFAKNKKVINIKSILCIIFALLIAGLLTVYMLYESRDALGIIMNTVYPGKRVSLGGDGWQFLFTYFSSFKYSYSDMFNPCEYSQFISLFPIPVIVAIYLNIKNAKNKKVDLLLLLLTIVTLLLLIWNFVQIPEIISKITLLSFSTPYRSQVTVGYISVLLLVYILSKYEVKFGNKVINFIISLVVVCFALRVSEKLLPGYLSLTYTGVMSICLFTSIYLFLSDSKKYQKYFIGLMLCITIIPGLLVNPIVKGSSVMYDKPVAKEIQKITNEDKNSKWVVVSKYYLTANYFMVNGAPSINSVNIYPNIDLWKKIDKNGLYESIYNRYAHILVTLTSDDTSFEIFDGADLIRINLNYDELDENEIKYIATDYQIDSKTMKDNDLEELYSEYGLFIYKNNY